MKTRILAIATLCIVTGSLAAFAHGGATGVVKERMDAMERIGTATKSVGQMLRGKTAFDAGAIEAAANDIKAHAGAKMTDLFPEGSLKDPSEASPKIWQDWAGFEAKANDLAEKAGKLSTVAAAGSASTSEGKQAISAAFGEVAGTCKSCHETYRVKKD
jgi:cytochrome c556